MLLSYALGLVVASSLAAAQINSEDVTATVTGTAPTFSATTSPCAAISSYLSVQSAANPSATAIPLDASFAYECALSAPVVQEDALNLIDSLLAVLEWQSTLGILKNPPAGYPLAGVDLLGELADVRSQVVNGDIISELVLQTNITSVLSRAHDGHLWFSMDAIGVFEYQRPYGPLVSYSVDGVELPKLYLYYEMAAYLLGNSDYFPSAVISINGIDATQFIEQLSQNGTDGGFQDPDALWNANMYSLTDNTTPAHDSVGYYFRSTNYPGDSTSLSFENGTQAAGDNIAITLNSFEGVYDGPSFYNAFCNATYKTGLTTTQSSRVDKRQAAASTPTVTQLPGYPAPDFISSDGAFSGYFLDDPGYESTAVLVLDFMSEDATLSAQSTLTDFLNACRTRKTTNLVIDITGNPGGEVILGFEVFKQLFPNLDPYQAWTQRISNPLNETGQLVTAAAAEVAKNNPNNITAYQLVGGTSDFNAAYYNNDSGSPFTSWASYFEPIQASGDNYTNLLRWRLENYATDLSQQITISGYGKDVGPQPFDAKNIIIVGDGRCSSTCTILSNLLKWQGKVKSIALGGRPSAGPMQSQGGVKGSSALSLKNAVINFGLWSSQWPQDIAQQSQADTALTSFGISIQNLLERTQSYGTPEYASANDLDVNWRNSIREGDSSYVPLQFVYEAADCRLWQKPSYLDPSSVWKDAATTAFGLNGTTPWAMCVQGSTNHPSSLSGNATLYNNGIGTNVTVFTKQDTSSTTDGGKKKNGAGQMSAPLSLALLVTAVMALLL